MFVAKLEARSLNLIVCPTLADEGSVTVTAPELVLMNKKSPAVAVYGESEFVFVVQVYVGLVTTGAVGSLAAQGAVAALSIPNPDVGYDGQLLVPFASVFVQ